METFLVILDSIPLPLATLLAGLGVLPLLMSLSNPPKGSKQIALYSVVYLAGAIGMMSAITQTFMPSI